MSYTPGPWKVMGSDPSFVYSLNEHLEWYRFELRVVGGYVYHDKTTDDEVIANAKLISLCPDMYEVLEEVFTQLESPSRNTTISSHRRDGSVIISSDIREKIRRIISKVKGES